MGLPLQSARVPRDAAEARAFLQERLARVGRAAFLLTTGFWLLQNAAALPRPDFAALDAFRRGNAFAVAAAGVFGAMWLVTRRGERAERTLLWIDGAALPLVVALLSLGVVNATPHVRPDLAAAPQLAASLMAVTVMMFRAALVPSPATRTLFICAMIAGSPVAVAVLTHGPGSPVLKSSYVVLWMVVGSAVATMTSGALYGLRAAAREAQRLGQYRLTRRLGAGAMGEVYAAEHAMLRRATAIKLILAEKVDEAHVARFEREVQLTARLTHPNTVTVFDYGRTEDGVLYYAMELLDGVDLQRLVDRFGPQPEARVVALVAQACASLAEAHAVGLVHRDVKPANIMVCRRPTRGEVVKVLDFGLAMATSSEAPGREGAVVGTPLYLAPESILGEHIGPAADIYALGAVAFWLLVGEPPFPHATVVQVCDAHLHHPPPALAERIPGRVTPALAALVARCLAKVPADRPASAVELGRALAECGVGAFPEAEVDRFWDAYRPAAQAPVPPREVGVTRLGRTDARASA